MSRKLIEQYRRKADLDISCCTPIRLADGQEWYFPRPMVALEMEFGGDKPGAADRYLTCGEDLDKLVAAIGESDDPEAQIKATLWMGGALLRRNYDITDKELKILLRYREPDEASSLMLGSIIDVATGMAPLRDVVTNPKGSAVGSDSHSGPTA